MIYKTPCGYATSSDKRFTPKWASANERQTERHSAVNGGLMIQTRYTAAHGANLIIKLFYARHLVRHGHIDAYILVDWDDRGKVHISAEFQFNQWQDTIRSGEDLNILVLELHICDKYISARKYEWQVREQEFVTGLCDAFKMTAKVRKSVSTGQLTLLDAALV